MNTKEEINRTNVQLDEVADERLKSGRRKLGVPTADLFTHVLPKLAETPLLVESEGKSEHRKFSKIVKIKKSDHEEMRRLADITGTNISQVVRAAINVIHHQDSDDDSPKRGNALLATVETADLIVELELRGYQVSKKRTC